MVGTCCFTDLLSPLDRVTKPLDEGHWVDVRYMDIGKAFDPVNRDNLDHRIKALGRTGRINT